VPPALGLKSDCKTTRLRRAQQLQADLPVNVAAKEMI